MSFCLKISRDKLYKKEFVPDEVIRLDKDQTNVNYESLVILLGTIFLQNKGG